MYDHYLSGEDSDQIKESDLYYKGTIIFKYINGYLVVSDDLGISQ